MNETMYSKILTYENLLIAFHRAKKGKSNRSYVKEFEKNLKENLLDLRNELIFHTYKPRPLTTFILKQPKTRKICRSDFRDRVIHHALCNIIEPIFDKTFIYDSYSNRVCKGTLKAIERFDNFKRKVTKNNSKPGFVLKADIKHYFDSVSHNILIEIIKKKIKDKKVIWLIEVILKNYQNKRGMPLGNLTSQFFANVFLNVLDQFVKHKLRAKYYIRYVDDFVILHSDVKQLEQYKEKINQFLEQNLELELHPDKTKIFRLQKGTTFLGINIFYYHKTVKKSNMTKFYRKLNLLENEYEQGKINYDTVCDFIEGWCAYARYSNTYKIRKGINERIEKKFAGQMSSKEIDRYLRANKKIKNSSPILIKQTTPLDSVVKSTNI